MSDKSQNKVYFQRTFSDKLTHDINGFKPELQCDVGFVKNTFVDDSY